jgi:hypothetical protein
MAVSQSSRTEHFAAFQPNLHLPMALLKTFFAFSWVSYEHLALLGSTNWEFVVPMRFEIAKECIPTTSMDESRRGHNRKIPGRSQLNLWLVDNRFCLGGLVS